ncbi:MAG: hypothetical protein AUG51_05125 [Acidobacteria bacterium 13_1_20CM_3_53_8]|nr:MAG: hypothetical protein AUG51_05125 [Acidobacteria bacterium 13_1_20CM_3_53_8]
MAQESGNRASSNVELAFLSGTRTDIITDHEFMSNSITTKVGVQFGLSVVKKIFTAEVFAVETRKVETAQHLCILRVELRRSL